MAQAVDVDREVVGQQQDRVVHDSAVHGGEEDPHGHGVELEADVEDDSGQDEETDAQEGLGGVAGEGVDASQATEVPCEVPERSNEETHHRQDEHGPLQSEAHLLEAPGAVVLTGHCLEHAPHAVHHRDPRDIGEHVGERNTGEYAGAVGEVPGVVAGVSEGDDVAQHVQQEGGDQRGGLHQQHPPRGEEP